MIRRDILVMLLAVGLLVAAGCVAEEPPAPAPGSLHIFGEINDNETYTVPAGSTIRLRLPENPTTGYQWSLEIPDGISMKADEFVPPDTELVGAPGTHLWMMEATTPGRYTMLGRYIRPWETDADPEETFTLTLIVDASIEPFYTFDQSTDGETFMVPVGAEVRLRLPENPTTGYEWSLDIPDGIVVTADEFIPPRGVAEDECLTCIEIIRRARGETSLDGASGIHVWTMETRKPGMLKISANYLRIWEPGAEPAQTFTLTLDVQ